MAEAVAEAVVKAKDEMTTEASQGTTEPGENEETG
jgi:hypothetical protein